MECGLDRISAGVDAGHAGDFPAIGEFGGCGRRREVVELDVRWVAEAVYNGF